MVAATGYDPLSKKLIQIGFDNLGGRWTETADSATPDKPVFSGKYTLNGNEIGVRDTYSYEGRKCSHLGEIQVGGDWKKLDEETCKK